MPSEYGVIVTESGINVDSAADYQHVIDSRFPGMFILQEGFYQVDSITLGPRIAAFSLSFVPFCLVFLRSVGGKDNKLSVSGTLVDKNGIYLDGVPASSTLHYFIFNVPIDKDYQTPFFDITSSALDSRSSYGFMVPRTGRNVVSLSPENALIDTAAHSYSVYMVETGKIATGVRDVATDLIPYTVTAQHNLGYPPLCFGIIGGQGSSSDKYRLIRFISFIDENIASIENFSTPDTTPLGIVVMRNPIAFDNETLVSVTYG